MHPTLRELELSLPELERSPVERGVIEMICSRPTASRRQVLTEAELDPEQGMVGDDWVRRFCKRTEDGSPHRGMQMAIMNSRVAHAVSGDRARWALAGDQLFVDFDLAADRMVPGARLAVGDAVVQVTDMPHTGCAKFAKRFGADALRFLNSPRGRAMNMRGIFVEIVTGGTVRVGDSIEVVS